MMSYKITQTRYPLILTIILLSVFLVLVGATRSEAATSYQLEYEWGSFGRGDGQFDYPSDVALDAGGNVYVADRQNTGGISTWGRIQKFQNNGLFDTKWNVGGFANKPTSIDVGPSGNVYVTENVFWHKVLKFDSTGTPITSWGSLGAADGQFFRPVGIEVDGNENVYVTDYWEDPDTARIQKFNGIGTHLPPTWGTLGIGQYQLIKPSGIAVDAYYNTYVVDFENNKVVKYDSNRNPLTEWGSFGSNNSQFDGPEGIAIDSSGFVYVTDGGNNRVQKFDANGQFIKMWGAPAPDINTFMPRGIAVDNTGLVFVSDVVNNKIKVFKEKTAVVPPTGSVLINGGAASTNNSGVSLSLSSVDSGGNPPVFMRLSNNGITWPYGWVTYKQVFGWILKGNFGTNTVFAQFRDASDLRSAIVQDTINLTVGTNPPPGNTQITRVELKAPRLTTRYHNRTDFKVSWKAVGTLPPGGITGYDVKYKINRRKKWVPWLTNTRKKIARMKGRPGQTFRMRARAHGADGSTTKWSKSMATVIPQDNGTGIYKRRGFGVSIKKKKGSRTYLNTIRRSTRRGHYVTYRFKGKAAFVIATKGRYYSMADIYVNGRFIERVNGFSHRTRYRKVLWGKSWGKYRTRTIKIVNVGNKRRIDLDALAVLR